MNLVKVTEKAQLQIVEQLYLVSFPECERKPFTLIIEKSQKNLVDIWQIEENGEFCGLVITMKYKDLVLIDYLAIATEKRGLGYGSKTLELIGKQYEGGRVFLEIESTNIAAENHEERRNRKRFYLNNGLKELGMETLVFETIFEVLFFEKKISFEEYWSVYAGVYGEEKAAKVKLIGRKEVQGEGRCSV